MRRIIPLFVVLMGFIGVSPAVAEEGIKVVPIGDTIKPDSTAPSTAPTSPVSKPVKRKPKPIVVKAGKEFSIEVATAMSSGLTKPGEVIYFLTAEEIGPANRPLIARGAVGEGKVISVDAQKKHGKLVVELSEVEAVSGEDVSVNGTIEVVGEKGAAAIAFGDRFNATLEEKVVAKRRAKKESTSFKYHGIAEVSGKGVKVDIQKGVAKGKVQVLIEPPAGTSLDDVDEGYLVLYKVNDFQIPTEVSPLPGSPKVGDANKNGTKDLTYQFDSWTFVKYQPRGQNNISFKGKLRDGTPFEAPARVTVDY